MNEFSSVCYMIQAFEKILHDAMQLKGEGPGWVTQQS